MSKTTPSILRANQVQFQGPLQLGLDATARPEPQTDPGQAPPQPEQAQPQARIAENHPEYALVELTCTCGKTTYIRCDYTGPA